MFLRMSGESGKEELRFLVKAGVSAMCKPHGLKFSVGLMDYQGLEVQGFRASCPQEEHFIMFFYSANLKP